MTEVYDAELLAALDGDLSILIAMARDNKVSNEAIGMRIRNSGRVFESLRTILTTPSHSQDAGNVDEALAKLIEIEQLDSKGRCGRLAYEAIAELLAQFDGHCWINITPNHQNIYRRRANTIVDALSASYKIGSAT